MIKGMVIKYISFFILGLWVNTVWVYADFKLEAMMGGSVLNVVQLESGKKRGLSVDDPFRFRDQLKLPSRLAIWVKEGDKTEWVGGGSLSLHFEDLDHTLRVDSGLIRFATQEVLTFQSKGQNLIFKSGSLGWLWVKEKSLDVYLAQGEVTYSNGMAHQGKVYLRFIDDRWIQNKDPKAWDLGAMEVHFSSFYPNVVKLSSKMNLIKL